MTILNYIVFFILIISSDGYGGKCGPHESYFPCGNLCEPTCFKGDGAICIRLCGDPACGCVNGFYRSLSGDCVRYEECLKSNVDKRHCTETFGPNAMLSPKPSCPIEYCDTPDIPVYCKDLPGCICKPGHKLNRNFKCVESTKCLLE